MVLASSALCARVFVRTWTLGAPSSARSSASPDQSSTTGTPATACVPVGSSSSTTTAGAASATGVAKMAQPHLLDRRLPRDRAPNQLVFAPGDLLGARQGRVEPLGCDDDGTVAV